MRPQSAVLNQEVNSDLRLNLNQNATNASSSKYKSPRPATAGLTTSRSSISSRGHTPRQNAKDTGPHRDAVAYFDKFKKNELRELIAESTASWLLSPEFRGQASLPSGLISNLSISQSPHLTLLFPKDKEIPELEYRELHQIVRELTSGIFGMNQMPSFALAPNFDLSTTCQLPKAYKDTRVGQVLLEVDYAMKSLWHGANLIKSKRTKLAERWRGILDVNNATGEWNQIKNPLKEFAGAGQEYLTENDNLKNIYEELNKVDPSEFTAQKENKFFNSYAEFVRCVISVHTSKVKACKEENVILLESQFDVSSSVELPDADSISAVSQQRLRRRLRQHLKMIRKGLNADPQTKRNISLLKFISSVSLVLVALRLRLMRVPNTEGLLAQISGDILRTETELPPFAIGPKGVHPCETFTLDRTGQRALLSHSHGEIQFDIETSDIESFFNKKWCHDLQEDAEKHLKEILQERLKPGYPVPTIKHEKETYYVVRIPLETYYPASPPLPGWLHARYQLLSSLRPRKLPMNDIQLSETFKQVFGFRTALANKGTEASLRLCACRGLVAPFIALLKKTASSSLFSPDLKGFTLLHYACIHNKASILSLLLSQNPNVNVRRTEINLKSTRISQPNTEDGIFQERSGATALHFAARCGALECVTALLASKANPILSDGNGRNCLHHASESDQVLIIRVILRKHPNLLEVPATGGDNVTPLLVAASSGSLEALKCLIMCGANIHALDCNNDGLVQRAILHFHTDLLHYFVKLKSSKDSVDLGVWDTLVEMLKSPSIVRQDASLRCLEVLLHNPNEEEVSYWKALLDAGVVGPLVHLLNSGNRRPKSATIVEIGNEMSPPIRSLACSVVCLMSEHNEVRVKVAASGAIPVLISLLKPSPAKIGSKSTTESEQREIQSRSSVVLSDLARVDDNATIIADSGAIRALVDLLRTDVVDVLVNAVVTLSSLCRGDTEGKIQDLIIEEEGASGLLVFFLGVKDDALQAATADAVAAISYDNFNIQNEFLKKGALKPLATILKGHCINSQMKAALAVDCMTRGNLNAQKLATLEGTPDALCRLFQIWSDSAKERGASALWSLAGDHPEQQRAIARRIGTKQIIDMLLSKSDTLQLIGCKAIEAWSKNSIRGQSQLSKDRTIPPLIRLLRLSDVKRNVILACITAINSLCIGVAQVNNRQLQLEIEGEEGVELILDKIWQTSHDEDLQVELLYSLSCLVSSCVESETKLNHIGSFSFDILLTILHSPNVLVKSRACSALAMFAFNRLPQQQKIQGCGGLSFDVFFDLFSVNSPLIAAATAFQLVVLARVVVDTTIVEASSRGILELIDLLNHNSDDVIISTAGYLSSLSHTRAGVPEAIVTSGAVGKLLYYLKSENDQVRLSAAQALGYLSFNRTASRELMASCRSEEGIYPSLINNLGEDGRISDEFLAEFKRQTTVGLPIPKATKRQNRASSAVNRPFSRDNK